MARKTTSTKKSAPRKTGSTRKEVPVVARQQKPVFRAGTVITVILLAALVGFAFYLNREKESTDAETTSTVEETAYVFDVESSSIQSIEVKPADGEAVKVVRNDDNVWAMELPFETEADQGLAEAAATQVSTLQVDREIDDDPATFGLDQPAYVITIEYVDGKIHTLEVGDSTPTNSGYYVRVDKDKMMIVSLSGIDSLINLLDFPPYLNTPTPTSLPPTETPVPPTEAISTLEATVTPTP
jgi:hypothetical protein